MKRLVLLLAGVAVGWAAAGIDLSQVAMGQAGLGATAEATVDDAPTGARAVAIPAEVAELGKIPASPPIGPMVETATSRDARKVAPSERYKALTRVDVEKRGGRTNADGIIGAHDLKYLTAGLNELASEGWLLKAIEPAHRYSISGPGNASITTPPTYIFERR